MLAAALALSVAVLAAGLNQAKTGTGHQLQTAQLEPVPVFGAQPLPEAIADLQAGRLDQAERKLTWLLRDTPDSVEANFYLSLVKFQSARLAEARPSLEKAVRLAPGRAGARKALGITPEQKLWRVHRATAQAFEALGRSEEAERHFREAVAWNRGRARPDEDPRIDYGIFLFRQGRIGESLHPLEEAVNTWPSCARAHGELGRSLLQLDRLETAAAHLNPQ